jgi:hypothetical protein
MKLNHRRRFVFLLALLDLCGCGAGGMTSPQPAPTLTGNWLITNTPNSSRGVVPFGAFLSQTGTSVSGTAHLEIGQQIFFEVPVIGTIQNGELAMGIVFRKQNFPFDCGMQESINASVTSSRTSFMGNFGTSGSCASTLGGSGTVLGEWIAPFNGHWIGSLQSSSGPVAQLSADFTESNEADSTGSAPLSGSLTFSGEPCLKSGSFTGHQVGTFIPFSIITTADGEIDVSGESGNPGNLLLQYTIVGGNCSGDSGTITLTLH